MTIQRSWANRTAIGILLRRMQVRALSSAPIRRRVFLALFRCGESGPRVTMAWGAAEALPYPQPLNDHDNQNDGHANRRPQSDFLHSFVIHRVS